MSRNSAEGRRRAFSPEAIAYLIKVVRDENESTGNRMNKITGHMLVRNTADGRL
jgi:hypothetical protein